MMTVPVVKNTKLAAFCQKMGYWKKNVFMYVKILDVPTYNVSLSIGGWDGGFRSIEHKWTPATGEVCGLSQMQPFGLNTPQTCDIDAENAVVTTGTFCGKPATMSITCTRDFFNKYLEG